MRDGGRTHQIFLANSSRKRRSDSGTPFSVSRTDLALPTGLWIIPLSCSRFMTDQSNPFHARPSRSSVNRAAPKRRHRPCLRPFPRVSLAINSHPISTLLPPNDRMHPPQLFFSVLPPAQCQSIAAWSGAGPSPTQRSGSTHFRRRGPDRQRARRRAMIRTDAGGMSVEERPTAAQTRSMPRSGGRD